MQVYARSVLAEQSLVRNHFRRPLFSKTRHPRSYREHGRTMSRNEPGHLSYDEKHGLEDMTLGSLYSNLARDYRCLQRIRLRHIHPSTCLSTFYLFIYPSIHSIYPFYLTIYSVLFYSIYLSVCLPIHRSIYLTLC